MRKLWKTLFILVVLAGASAGVYAWTRNGKKGDGGLKQVEVTKARSLRRQSPSGRFSRARSSQVKSKISGIVRRALVQVGDTVKAGDPALRDRARPDAARGHRGRSPGRIGRGVVPERARATTSASQRALAIGVLPKSDVEAKREAYELPRVALDQGRAESRPDAQRTAHRLPAPESIIRAPAAGTILTRAVNPGDPIVPLTSYQPGTEMATIADMRDLIFKGTVDEIDVGKLSVGMTDAHQSRRAADRRRHRPRLPHRAAGAAERRRHALRRRDRARAERRSPCAPATPPTPTSSSARRRTS